MPSAFFTAAGEGSATAAGTDTPNELFVSPPPPPEESLAESLDALEDELDELDEFDEFDDDGVVEDDEVENE